MTSKQLYPSVRILPENKPMVEAWRTRAELLLQHCDDCGKVIFYPRVLCPVCWSSSLTWRRATGAGEIVSFSLVYRGLPDAFMKDVPIVLAELRLAEGVHMIARVLHRSPEAAAIGDRVKLVVPGEDNSYPLPTFCMDESS